MSAGDQFPSLCGPSGWECPKCGAVYAPFIPSCSHCAPRPSVTTPTIQPFTPDQPGSGTAAPPHWPTTVTCVNPADYGREV